jgi:hypothetical protein
MATGEDFRYPTTEGGRPDCRARLVHRYLDQVTRRAMVDPTVNEAFGHVINMTRPPTALFRPGILARALRPGGASAANAPPTATPYPGRHHPTTGVALASSREAPGAGLRAAPIV